MVKLSELRSDLKAERDGVWSTYVPGFDLLIASTATREFEDALRKAMEPWAEAARAGKLTDEIRDATVRDVYAEHVVRDWRGYDDDAGQPVPYSKAAAAELLKDPAMHRLWSWVQTVAGSEARYRVKAKEKALGN